MAAARRAGTAWTTAWPIGAPNAARNGEYRPPRQRTRRPRLATRPRAPHNPRIRYVAVDLGDKRTGLASGDSATGIVSPIDLVEVDIQHGQGGALLEAVARVVEEHLGDNPRLSRGEIVVGLPLNMDNTEGQRAKLVRAFAERLRSRCGRPLHYQDERLTSADADWQMAQSGLTHQQKKQRRDALAAAAILRDFLEARKKTPSETDQDPKSPDSRTPGW